MKEAEMAKDWGGPTLFDGANCGKASTPTKEAGEVRRDVGVAKRVAKCPEWHGKAYRLLLKYLSGVLPGPEMAFTSDDFRLWAFGRGLGEPDHPNSWGALFLTVAREGRIKNTDRTRKTTRAKGQARRLVLWMVPA